MFASKHKNITELYTLYESSVLPHTQAIYNCADVLILYYYFILCTAVSHFQYSNYNICTVRLRISQHLESHIEIHLIWNV